MIVVGNKKSRAVAGVVWCGVVMCCAAWRAKEVSAFRAYM